MFVTDTILLGVLADTKYAPLSCYPSYQQEKQLSANGKKEKRYKTVKFGRKRGRLLTKLALVTFDESASQQRWQVLRNIVDD